MELIIKYNSGIIAEVEAKTILQLDADGSLLCNPEQLDAAARCLSETLNRVERLKALLGDSNRN